MTKKGKAGGGAAVAEPPAKQGPATGPVKETHRGDVMIDSISVRANHRRHFDEKRLNELAENIKKVGVLEPILLRAGGNLKYELIAGERRLRAAKQAGLIYIPVRVLDVNEAQAAEIQALENLHREDLGPIEEAQAFKLLLENGQHTVETLAERIDRSVPHIYRSLRLLELPEKAIQAIEEEQITAAHGTVLSRLQDPKEQESLLQAIIAQKLSAKAAENALAEHAREISKAPFNTFACAGCKHNGKKQKDLFDSDTNLEGRCMNPACFDQNVKEAKGEPDKRQKTTKTKGKAPATGSQSGLDTTIEKIVDSVRKDSNLGYMRVLASGILGNADDRVKLEFMRRRDPSIKKGEVDKEVRKYLEKLTDFFIPGFCVEMTILSENAVKEGELVHQFKKLYGLSKSSPAAGPADKAVQDSLKQIGAQMAKDEKAAKAEEKK
ncbi:MAG: ParB/RepB/Spo0J family partition protein [Elusimicrobia bacterium]|nr:ParB/RepB/Spo0J family partition protein [Elusimicrobiota bacterium]